MPKSPASKGKSVGSSTVKANKAPEARTIVFPEYEAEVRTTDNPITYEEAKELLGWTEEPDDGNWGADYLLVHNGKKIRCLNNPNNRPLNQTSVNTLMQEFLRGRWRLNGETIILGQSGAVLNGQHTLIAFIQAVDEWKEHPDNWPETTEEPVLTKFIAKGIVEDDETVNTMDTCKPRTLWEVICRASYFSTLPLGARKTVARRTEAAVKMLWHRTGTHSNAFAVKRTHAESIGFLEAHPKLLEAVSFIHEEDGKDGKINKYVSAGYAAAALYLMGSSDTDPETYYTHDTPSEKLLDFSKWERACEFFVLLAAGDKGMKPVRDEIDRLIQDGSVSVEERWTLLAKAWESFSENNPITVESLELEFTVKDGVRHLTETALMGGVDIGDEGLSFIAGGDPTPEVIEKKAEKVREARYKKNSVKVAKQATPGEWHEGDTAWVHNYDALGSSCFGTIKKPYECYDGEWRVFIDAEDGEWEVPLASLSLHETERIAQ